MAHPEEQETNTAILGLSKLLPPIHSKFRIHRESHETRISVVATSSFNFDSSDDLRHAQQVLRTGSRRASG